MIRVLVAEDDETSRTMLRLVLERKGYEVVGVDNGKAAIQAILRERFDLLLLDVNMPVMSGFEALPEIKKIRPLLPIVMATAETRSEEIVRALEQGADDYITKPFDFPVLLARVEARIRAANHVDESPASEFSPGMIIADRYQLHEPIGKGSFGVVFRAHHLTLETDVALKVLRLRSDLEVLSPIDSLGRPQGRHSMSGEAAEDFRLEGVNACRVPHDNAVRVLDHGVLPSGVAYLAMELLTGHTLERELQRDTTTSLARAIQVLSPVCSVLATAHERHIVHRDIKPANIFLHRPSDAQDKEIVKVLDFGVAKLVEPDAKATRDAIAGTPAYLAPERLRGRRYDGRSDVYSVGAVLYEMLTGRPPFTSADNDPLSVAMMHLKDDVVLPSVRVPGLPQAVDDAVIRLLNKEPTQRPNAVEAEALFQDLLDVL